MSHIDEEEEIQNISRSFWIRTVSHIRNAESINKYAGTGVIIFGLIATAGGIIASSTSTLTTLSASTIGVLGAILAVLCAFVQKFLEKDHVSLIENAKISIDKTQAYIYQRKEFVRQIEDMKNLDLQRIKLQACLSYMLEQTEQLLLSKNIIDIRTALDGLLDLCQAELLAAMGMTYAEKTTISIYCLSHNDNETENTLNILLVKRPNKAEEQEYTSRSWIRGEGYTGMAWLRQNEVIIPDSMLDGVQSGFFVRSLSEQSEDLNAELKRYRSIASVPIFIGESNHIWGVVSVTTNQVNKFSTDAEDDVATQNVETVRTLAKMIAVLVACCAKQGQEPTVLAPTERDQVNDDAA